jgi:putative transposase
MTMSQGSQTIQRRCRLAGVSRAGYYRLWRKSAPREHDTAVRSAIQRVALANGRHRGYRYISHLLRREDGMIVNHKRVLRLMRQDNLLCLRRKAFVPQTTDSRHDWEIVPNLARGLRLSGLDQLWVADITYIRLETEFVYLAVVLDAFSRRVIGWALDRTLEASLAVQALKMAFRRRGPVKELTHHSDRGVQYACKEYTDLLKEHGVRISMSRRGNPYDNAKCESFMKTLKYEEVYRQEYRDLAEAQASIERFIEKIYNGKRLHSALGYCSPIEFERSLIFKEQTA